MSQQQQSEQQPQPPQQPQQPNWLVVLFVTVTVGGVVQVLVNHYDAIAAAIVGLFSHIHLPPLQGSPAFEVLSILSGIAVILPGGLAIILFSLNHQRQRSQSLMEEHLRLVVKNIQQIKERTQQAMESNQQATAGVQQMKEYIQQLEEQLAKQQRTVPGKVEE